jgi:CRP-like cAMP-binding protein
MPDLYFLVEFPIFRDFDADDVDALGPVCELLSLPKGTVVCREGDPGDAMYVVKSGVLDVSRRVAGTDAHINLLSEGEFFGEMALIDSSPRSADVTVQEDAVLVKLPAAAFKQLKAARPASALKVAEVLLKQLSFRVRRTTTRALASEAAPAQASAPAKPGAMKVPKKRAGKRPGKAAKKAAKSRTKARAKTRPKTKKSRP